MLEIDIFILLAIFLITAMICFVFLRWTTFCLDYKADIFFNFLPGSPEQF